MIKSEKASDAYLGSGTHQTIFTMFRVSERDWVKGRTQVVKRKISRQQLIKPYIFTNYVLYIYRG